MSTPGEWTTWLGRDRSDPDGLDRSLPQVLVSELHFSPGLRNSGALNSDELAMFHKWLQLIFAEYQKDERRRDSEEEEVMEGDEEHGGTGELAVRRALEYAKEKGGWTMQRAQKLIDKLTAESWITVVRGAWGGGGKGEWQK